MLRILKVSTLLLVVLLSGCQTFKAVEPDQSTQLGNITIKTERQWSQYNSLDKTVRILTRDGILLNVVSVINVKDGQHIYKQRVTERNKGFKFDKSMTLIEASELYLDALNASNAHNIEILDESERMVSNNEAIKLEYTYDTEFGLTYHQMALIIKHGNQIDILNCFAPQEHYYPLLENEFHSIIESAKISS